MMLACLLSAVWLAAAAGVSRASTIPCATAVSPGVAMADFSLAKQGGVFHLFHTCAAGSTSNRFGHLTSTDLYHWAVKPDVMVGTQATQPGVPDGRNGWNRDRIWAPSIVQQQGQYYMFYTGVRSRPSGGCLGQVYQEIGIATSSDLDNWSLELDPSLTPLKATWTLQDTCQYEYGNFRDPHVTQDPATGEWLMSYTTIPNSDAALNGVACTAACTGGCRYQAYRFVIGLAHAPSLFTSGADWEDLQALWATYQTTPTSCCFRTWESPHLIRHAHADSVRWYLFATAGTDLYATDLVCLTSASPTAEPEDWTYRGHLEDMGVHDPYGNVLGPYETYGWIASEYLLDPADGREYFANVSGSSVQLRQILWRSTGVGFDLVEPFRITALEHSRTEVGPNSRVQFTFYGRNCVDPIGARSVPIEAVRVDENDNVIGVIPRSRTGLPASVTLTGDMTNLSWTARTYPSGQLTRMRLRLMDTTTTIISSTLIINPVLPSDVGATDAPAPLALRVSGAVPAVGATRLSCSLPAAGEARLELFAVDGRRVRTLHGGAWEAGTHDVTWDLRDDDGHRVGAGVYFARLVTPAGTRSARLVVTTGE